MMIRMGIVAGLAFFWQALCGPSQAHAHPPGSLALRNLNQQIAEAPARPDLLLRRALVLLTSGDRAAALEDLRLGRDLGGDPFEIDLLEARVRLANDQFDEALDSISRALVVQPDHSGGRWLKGRILVAMGRSDDGVRELSAAYAESVRRTPERLLELVDAYEAARRSEEALQALDRGIADFGSLTVLQRRALMIESCHSGESQAGARLAAVENPWQRRILEAESLALLGHHDDARLLFEEIANDLSLRSESRLALRWQRRVDEGLASMAGGDSGSRPPGCGGELR